MPNGTTHRMEMKSHKVVADVGNKIPDLYVYSFVGFPNETLEGVYYVFKFMSQKDVLFQNGPNLNAFADKEARRCLD